jgi:hypothetical protein
MTEFDATCLGLLCTAIGSVVLWSTHQEPGGGFWQHTFTPHTDRLVSCALWGCVLGVLGYWGWRR